MHKLLFCILLISSTSAFALTKESGTVYVCANKENTVKMTADLSDRKFDQAVVVTAEGVTKVFREFKHKTRLNLFLVGSVKNSTLLVRKTAKSPVLVSLETTPETSRSQLALSGEGVAVTKFDAVLTSAEMHVSAESVSCLETKWTEQ